VRVATESRVRRLKPTAPSTYAANKARHANRKLSNSNSANPSPPRFRALERGDDRAATRAARALKHARRTRKRTEAGDHKRG
jgi:hypothetical protein